MDPVKKLEKPEYYERREQEFVAWFRDKHGREPDHRDVEKRWGDFIDYEAKQHGARREA